MSGIALGLALTRERLRGVSAPLVLLLGAVAVFAWGVLLRRGHPSSAADETLGFAVFGCALPVFSYLFCERVCAGQSLTRSVEGVTRHGAQRRAVLFGVLLGSALGMALSSAVLTLAALLGAHPAGSALTNDLRASLGVALLAGAVYALWFAAAARFGRRGSGRKWALILDFLLGAGGSVLALPWPRGHVRNLLGGEPVLGLSQAGAMVALALIGALCLAVCLAGTPD